MATMQNMMAQMGWEKVCRGEGVEGDNILR